VEFGSKQENKLWCAGKRNCGKELGVLPMVTKICLAQALIFFRNNNIKHKITTDKKPTNYHLRSSPGSFLKKKLLGCSSSGDSNKAKPYHDI